MEAVYLLGEFGVRAVAESTRSNCIRMNSNFMLVEESAHSTGELTLDGYPLYTGSIMLAQKFTLSAEEAATDAELEITDFRACLAEVVCNGISAGFLYWAPYRISLKGLLHAGDNTLEIRLTNTLRNLLGPYHRPKGEYGECWPGYARPTLPWIGAVDENTNSEIPNWEDKRVPDTNAWTESYLQVSFGVSTARLLLI